MSLLLSPGLSPFLVSAGLVICLLALEIVLMMTGLSSHSGTEGSDLSHAPELGHDLGNLTAPDLAAELDIPPALAAQIEADLAPHLDMDPATPMPTASAGGILDILGIRKLPLTVWLALFFAAFAGAGLALQVGLHAAFGRMLPRLPAAAVALIPGLALTRGLAGTIARLIPRDETAAISERSLGRRRGVVTVGTARRGSPAQVRIADQYGNVHYTLVEPLDDADEIPEGAEVVVLRLRGGILRLVQIG